MQKKAYQVEGNTSELINRRIAKETELNVKYLSLQGNDQIERRISELDNEWDIERALEVNAASLALAGVLLGALLDKKWLILPGIVTGFLIQHAVQGWCPPLPLFRRFGVRTREEINKEKNALKAVRGDFKEASLEKDEIDRADKALIAVNGKGAYNGK